jgi:hypothetical protein
LNIITKVYVEYEIKTDVLFKVYEDEPTQLKVNPKDNTINIKTTSFPIPNPKDNWNRKEAINLLLDFNSHIGRKSSNLDEIEFNQYIKQNLK